MKIQNYLRERGGMSLVGLVRLLPKTSRILGYFLLINLCGSSCSCFSCDKSKTKLTPSPKTEVWTLDWSLTKYITRIEY